MHRTFLVLILIGCLGGELSAAHAEAADKQGGKPPMVYVEPTNLQTVEKQGHFYLVSYRNRRPKWAVSMGLDYSSYEPVNYEPNFFAVNFGDLYGRPSMPLVEFQMGVQRNYKFGALGAEFAAGGYQVDSNNPSLGDSTLKLYPIRVGAVVTLDTLFPEPYFVPYVSGGGYIMIYRESQQGNSHNGNSQIAPYVTAGVAMGLNWMNPLQARIAYEDAGIQDTFIFAEARDFFASAAAGDENFSSDLHWAAGLRIEF